MEQSSLATAGSSNLTAANNEVVEKDIREICAEVLRRPVGKIKLDKSFIAQGGDSLLAIKLMARCGEAGYIITINDMLQATSIRELCQSVKLSEGSSAPGKLSSSPVLDGPAQPAEIRTTPLTEVQRFYASAKAWDAKVFQLEGVIAESTLYAALKLLVSHHPILRANFTTLEDNELRLTYDDATETFAHRRIEIPTISTQAEQEYLTGGREADGKREDGLFAATVFVQQDRDHGTCLARYLRLDLHRAIVDVSSWDILQRDLDHAILGKPLARGDPETLFDSWASTRNQTDFKFEPSTLVKSTNSELNTNGTERQNGHHKDVKNDLPDVAILETDAAGLAKLEDEDIHSVLRTQPEDFIIAALYHAFHGITRSEEALSFGIISNGRRNGGSGLAATIGCFDDIIRRSVEREEEDDNLIFLRKVKDTRMGFFNGSRTSGVEDRSQYVLLHMGRLESTAAPRADTLQEVFHRDDFSTLPHGCLAFVEPFLEQQQLKLRLQSKSADLGREKLGQIAGLFRAALKELVAECEMSEVQGTLSDFPFLQLTYSELDNLVSTRLKAVTADPFRDVEAVFPCAPRQEAFLVAQAVYPDLYQCSFVIKMSSENTNIELDSGRLRDAWVRLVARHPALRTVFIESSNRQGHFDQVVMKQGISSIIFLEDEDEEAARQLACRRPVTFKSYGQTHQVTFCRISPSSVYLRLDMSHAVVDGLSAQVLMRDLFQLYGKQKLASRVMPYQDFVNYQARLPMQESMTYWSNYLAGAQPSHFPLYGDQLSREDLRTVRSNIQLGSDALGEFCGKFNITPANICQVAWALVLRSYTGLEDVCFSYATSGRDVPLKGINNTVGAFLNAVICRIKLPPTATVPQALIKARNDFVGSISHQYYSALDDAQSGDFARFKSNTLMSCQRKAATELAGSGLAFELVDAANPNDYDMSINIQVGPEGLEVMIDYWNSRIGQRTVESIAQSFRQAFLNIVKQEEALLGEIDISTPEEIDQLREWTKEIPPKADYRIHDKVYEQRLRQPDAWAVQGWDGDLTYQQLDDTANKLASYLIRLGVQPETKIPICFEKSKWAVISQLAILKAGGCVVPLGTKQPASRTMLILKDLQATVVLTTGKFATRFKDLVTHTVVIDEPFMAELLPSEMVPCPATVDNAAFIIYTSGSTGVPKGVVLPHASLCTSLEHMGARFKLSPDTRTVQFSAYTFDISIQDIYTTWHYGGCLIIISEEDRISNLAREMVKYQVNCAGLTSTVAGTIFPQDVPTLKTLVLLGEAVKPAVVDQWIDHVEVYNAYGPSECSMQASINRLTPGCNALNIGWAFAGALWVVDPNDYNRLVPIGAPGELLIEGPLQARGYLNSPEKTAAAFVVDAAWMIKNKFGSGRRLYRTGDLVQQNPDGSITYIGRRDTQIKVRGQRVEVGEIEHHLLQQDAVLDAAIIYPKQGPCKDRLVGLLTLRDFFAGNRSGQEVIPVPTGKLPLTKSQMAAASEELSNHVPEHMVPKIWIPLESMMPQNDSSKLDRKKLGLWLEAIDPAFLEALTKSSDAGSESREPETLLERQLQQAWADVLRLPPTQIPVEHKSFLSVGGDSITAMHAVSWLRMRGITVAVRDVLESKSVAQLAQTAAVKNGKTNDGQNYLLSPMQQWYFELIAGLELPLESSGAARYNSSICLIPRKPLDFSELAQAVGALVDRHPILRSRFQRHNFGGWRQYLHIDGDQSFALRHHNVSTNEEAEAFIAEAQGSLDLERGPVFSVQYIQMEGARNTALLFMTAHRLVVDEVSWDIIRRDISVLLEGQKLPTSNPLSFQTWVKLQAERSQNLERLVFSSDLPPADSEYWGLNDCNTHEDETVEEVIFNSHNTNAFFGDANEAFRTERVEILLAALFKSFHKTFPDRPVPAVFDVNDGRNAGDSGLDFSNTVGCFESMTPIYISLDEQHNDLDIVRQTKDARRSILGKVLSDGQRAFTDRQIEVLFQYSEGPATETVFETVELTGPGTSPVGNSVRRGCVFSFKVIALPDKLRIQVKFNRHIKYQEKIRDWAGSYVNAISVLGSELSGASPTLTVTDFPLLHLTPESLRVLQDEILPEAGLNCFDVEAIYPCSPIQQGILMSQVKSPSEYYIQQSFEIKPRTSSGKLDHARLLAAWQVLINRHPILRTRFVRSASGSSERLFDQVVLKSCKAETDHIECTDDDLSNHLAVKATLDERHVDKRIGHKLIIYSTSSNRTFGSIIISHALVDASSLMILQAELAQAYDGKLAPDTTGAAYSEYISHLQKIPADQALDYWTKRLADAEPCYLPALTEDGMQPATAEDSTPRRPMQTVSIDISCLEQLHSFTETYGITTANLFQLVWAMVLAQYTGSPNVSFGYLSSGRDVPVIDVEAMVGPLINMMVTHIKLDAEASVQSTLKQIQENFFESFNYQRAPLIEIWHALQLQGRSLFNTALSYRHVISAEKNQLSLALEQITGEDPTEYDVTISVFASPDKISASLQYSPDFLSYDSANRLLNCVQQGIQSLVANGNTHVRQLNTVTPKDILQVRAWNDKIPVVDGYCLIHDLFNDQRLLRPDATAVCAWDGNLTYQQLDDMSNALAHHLVTHYGIGPEVMVALCLDKSKFAIIAQLGVLKAAGVVVSINPKHPTQRLELVLKDIDAKVILTSHQYSSRFTNLVPHVLHMDETLFSALPPQTQPPRTNVTPDNAAFIIYTSGSTGMPKGVILTHLSLCSSFRAHGKVYEMSPTTRSLQFAAYTFDASISDIWGTMSHGGCVCVISEDERMNNLQGVIEAYGATHAQLTPTVAGLLDIPNIRCLITLILGGEAVREAMIEEYAKAAGRVKVLNGYGPSECSIYTTCSAPLVQKKQALNIGRPLVGSVWVVANGESICPVGAVGELWVEGPLLARGYHNDRKKTEATFVTNPKWANAVGLKGRRFYNTGDLVRQSSNGDLIYQARKDSQVKIRGQRVEVGEIEYRVKKSLPAVKSLVASLITPGGNSPNLIIVVAMELNDDFLQRHLLSDPIHEIFLPNAPHLRDAFTQLHASLLEALPSYMVPRLFVPVVHLPQTASSKLDRRTIKQMLENLPGDVLFQYSLSTSLSVAPSTDMEKKLQSLWATVLNVDQDRVGVQDHFLHSGGDSFTAMRLVSAANAKDIPISVADVFRYPRLQDMAAHLEGQMARRRNLKDIPRFGLWKEAQHTEASVREEELLRVAKLCDVAVDDVEDVYPCTPLQEGLMAITTQQPGSYIGRWVFRVQEAVDSNAFKRAWSALAQKVPILRTRIVPSQLGGLQVVVRESVAWGGDLNLKQYLEKDLQKSFGYGQPLVRQAVIDSGNKRYFVLTAHHSVYDGHSLGKLFDAVALLYDGKELAATPAFSRFISYIGQQDQEAAKAFWQSQIKGEVGVPFPSLHRPSYRPQPTQKLSSSVEIRPVGGPITLASTLRAAWALAISAYGGNDVLFGVALSGRSAPVAGILDMPAPTITTVPVHVHVNPEQTINEYLAMVHQQSVDMIPFEHTGLQNIRRFVGQIDLPHLFAVQPAQERENHVHGKLLAYEHGHVPELNLDGYALTVECITSDASDGPVTIEAHFDERMISASQTKDLLSRFSHIVMQLITTSRGQTQRRLENLDLLSEDEATRLFQFNQGIPPVKQTLVHELVSQQVSTNPDAPAVCAWDGDLTRGELDHLANKLALYLTTLGVKPETMVALCLEKSKWALVANLAVLKSGGAVVPIRADPIQRVQNILQQTGITTILASEGFAPVLEGLVPNVITIGDDLIQSLPSPVTQPISTVTPSNAAFVIFTSGSTGNPKGVVVEHGAMSTSMQAHGKKFGMNSETRAFNFAHFTFDISLHDIISTLQFGGCVCMPSERERVDYMAGAMNRMGVNYSFLPPRVIHTIKPSDVPRLKTLVVGGEAVQAEYLEPWLNGVRVFNAYGPAECSIAATCNEVADKAHVPNIGRAISGGLWVVDENDYNRLLPLGAVGELLIEGPLLARGYLNDPIKTANAFICNPAWISQYSKHDHGAKGRERRMYRTGDLVRQMEDGSLTYVGRRDGQVKIRGQRVEIGEIEHHVTEHPSVLENVMVYPRRGPAQSQLVGILTLHGFTSSDADEGIQTTPLDQLPHTLQQASSVREHLHSRVPEYMIPNSWISLAAMPHNTSDKIDRRRLTQWLETMEVEKFEAITQSCTDNTTTPSTSEEKNIQAVWADVLHVSIERVPMSRPFLSIGGDSVTAMQVVSKCRSQYSIYVTVRDVLQCESISQLAKKAVIKTMSPNTDTQLSTSFFDRAPAATGAPLAFYIDAGDLANLETQVLPRVGVESLSAIESIYHCSPIQQGILMSQIKDDTTYQVRQAGEICSADSSPVDINRLLRAWQLVVQRHAILRTFFVPSPSGQELFYQVVLKRYTPKTPVLHRNSDDFVTYFEQSERPKYGPGQPPCQLTLAQASTGQVYAQVDVNHVLMDASSMDLILNDLILAYGNMLSDSLAPSYGTYVSFLQQTSAADSLNYWTNHLSGAEPSYLPSSTKLDSGKRLLRTVSCEVDNIKPLQAFRDAHGVTIANITQLAWATVLSRYLGSRDVSFGYLSNGRDAPIAGIHEMCGPMINLMVTRVQFAYPGTTVAEAARQVQHNFLNGFNHQRASLSNIQHALHLSERGLFNTTMIYKPKPIMDAQEKRSLVIKSLAGEDPTEYDVQVKIVSDGNSLSLDLEYATTFMDEASARRLLSSLYRALSSIAANPNAGIDEIDVIPTADVELLHTWNSTVEETVPGSVHGKIHEQALSQPEAQAVCGWDGELTYAEITDMSDRLAHHLRNLGVRKEVMVGLCFDKSMWTVVSMIAVHKSGGVIVPLGVQLPAQRLRHILNETAVPVILTMDKHASKLRDITSASVLTIDGIFIATLPKAYYPLSDSGLTSESAAVVIYTSGSTGTPKGVVLTHGTICTSIESHGPKLQMGPNTRALQYSAYVFDLSLLDILSTLRFGGCVCVISEEDRVDINSLTTKMEAMAVNFAVLTPTVAGLIDPQTVPTLSTLVLAGEAVPPSAAETWASHVSLFNGYGPAESTILATVNGAIVEKEQASSVGRALAGAIWVVDTEDYNRLAPFGVVGELLISGPLVARGYLNDTERTSQSFITDPAFVSKHDFHSWAGKRMYKTGDLVRQDPTDGSIMFVGRADGQIKIRGQRVEVGEIEYWLRQHFDSQTVAVDVICASTGDVALAAAIELHKGPPSNECFFLNVNRQLRESFLQLQAVLIKALPSYMVPSKYIPVKNMPLTASGKLDRRRLRTLLGGLKEDQLAQYGLIDGDNVALSTETERRLANVWASALNTSKEFGANAHFFRVGGDSVTAMRLVALARTAQPPILLSVSDIFKHPVLSDMANTIADLEPAENYQYDNDVPPFSLLPYPQHERQTRLQEIASQCKVEVDVIEDAYPCTPLQQGLMAITAQHPEAYTSRWVFRLEDTIDVSRFREAWRTLVDLSPILRTRIIQDSKAGGMQVVLEDQIIWNNVLSELHSYITEDSAKSMGFGDSLMRFAVVTSGQGRFFVWTAHHSTYDGWTARKLMEAVFALYSNTSAPSFHPFARFVQHLRSNSAEETRDYWKSQLEGGMGPSFPQNPKNDSPRQFKIQSCRITANNSNDFTLSTLLRATWALILSQETGSQIVGFPTALSGRTAPVAGILDVLGPTITTVPIRISIDPAQSLSAYLASIQQQATDMLPFEHTGLHNISQMTSLPLNFQHLFVVQPAVDRLDQANSGFPGLTPVPFETSGFHNYPLVIECSTMMNDTDSAVDLQLQFDPAVLSVEKVTTILERFTHVFRQLQSAANGRTCEALVRDVNFMTPEDLGRIQKWNRFDDRIAMADSCIHDLVHQQLLSCPDAQAVHAFDGHLKYRELDRLATQLASHLVGLGVGPQVPVATVFEKTKWVVVTYLAVLKAGGTIVPVNHQHPKQRMQALVQSIGTRLILTSQNPERLQGLVTGPVLKVDQDLFTQLTDSDNPHPAVQATDSAFIIFTSGSTGTSKAVVLQHGAIVSSMVKGHGSLYASPDTRAIQFSALNFDISIAEIFTTLSFGGCVCVISEDDRVGRLADAMEEAAVNFAILTPTVASLLKPEQVPSLRKLLLVGEALRPEVAEPWSSSHVELHNAYGPAESSILTTFSQQILDPAQAPNIGFPLAHSNLFVVDPSDYHNLLPVGTVGELLIEGPLLAREYLGDAKKTGEAFVTNPAWLQQYDLGLVSGRRFYRTGDLVQQKLDGSFVYIGRRDTQVKIHGQRVEIGEIEYWVKNKFAGVREVVAGLFKPIHAEAEPLLAVAMEVPSSAIGSSSLLPLSDGLREAFGELRRDLLDVVPSYMVPQLYLPFAKLPLTDSGKLNRRATWEMIHSCGSWSQYFLVDGIKAEPATVTERLLQGLWATILKVPASSIGAKDDFFRSGGDSISAMRLVASAREHAQISLKVADIFRHSILSDMAALVDRTIEESTPTESAYYPFSTIPVGHGIRESVKPLLSVPGEIVDVAPTTDLQSLSIVTSLRPSRDLMAYVSIDGNGSPDFARWKASCLGVVKKHDILRTAYVAYEGQLLQVVLRDYAPAVTHYQTHRPIEEFTKELIAQDMHRPPQLGYPFLEFAIISSPMANQHRVLFRLSHAEYDAISLSYFVNTLREIYQRQSITEYVSFAQYISKLAHQDTESSREYWRSLLNGCTMPAITSVSQPRRLPSRQIYHDARRVSFKALPAGITLSTIVRSAWALTLANHVGNPDVFFGEVVSGRNSDPIAERAAGCCANLVPVRATIHPAWTTHDLLKSVQQQLVSRLPHESLGFRDLMRSCTDMPVGTVFTSLLNHLDQASEWTLDLDDGIYNVSVTKTEGAGDVSDVSITSTAGTGYVEIAMAYLKDGVTAELAEKLLTRLCETVDAFVNGALDAELPTVGCVSELNAQGGNGAPKFEGDLVDASLIAFELQKRGHKVTVDDIVEQGLSVSGV